jgi:uncharacterized phage protein (TIGR02218 family)
LVTTDGITLGFTSHDQPVVLDGVEFSPALGFIPSAVQHSGDLSVDNSEVQAIIDNDIISVQDLVSGKYDHASVDIAILNYSDITDVSSMDDGVYIAKDWKIGEVTYTESQFSAELRSPSDLLQQDIGAVFSASCRASLGDSRCGVNLSAYTVSGSVSSVATNTTFTDSARNEAGQYFQQGMLTWTSGPNSGLQSEIWSYEQGGVFILFEPTKNEIAPGDTYLACAGCDKSLSTCMDRFGNEVNFRGEPFVPGSDILMKYVVK